MKMRFASLMAAVLVAACSPESEVAAVPTPGEAPAAKRMPLPDCGEIEAQDAGADGWKHPDCRQMLADQSGLAIEARYAPAEDDSTEVKVQVVQPGDATIQEIVERMGNTFNGPNLEDFDKDGKTDILLPLETGNVNTTWAVWRQVEPGKFVRVGEPSGVSIIKTDSGLIAVQGRSSASEYYVDFFQLDADSLKPVATARVAARIEDDKVVGSDCTLEAGEGLAALGLAPEAAKLQYCAEPVVDGLVKDMTADQ